MRYEPYPYQHLGLRALREAIVQWQRIIACSPTGSGKTVMFMEIAHAAINKGKRVMIVVDTTELLDQAEEEANNYDLYPTIIKGNKKIRENSLYIASVQTLVNRVPPDIDLLIIDEGHILRFNKVLDHIYPNVKTITFTATPVFTWQNSAHLRYGAIITIATITELLEGGFLVPCRTVSPAEAVDSSDVKLIKNSQGQMDYDSKEMFQRFNKPKVYGAAVEQYQKFTPGEKAIVFCIDREHSITTMEAFRAKGIEAYHIDGTTPMWLRKQIVADFKNPNRKFVLCNCEIATKGFNVKDITCVIVFRSTASYALWKQMCGRGSRLFPGKDFFTVIDMGLNHVKHLFWEDDRDFPLETKKPKRGENFEPVSATKECPQCEALMHSAKARCAFCGYVYPVKEMSFLEGEFVVVSAPLIVKDRMAGKPKFYQMSDEELIEYGKKHKYKDGWALKQISMRQEQYEE